MPGLFNHLCKMYNDVLSGFIVCVIQFFQGSPGRTFNWVPFWWKGRTMTGTGNLIVFLMVDNTAKVGAFCWKNTQISLLVVNDQVTVKGVAGRKIMRQHDICWSGCKDLMRSDSSNPNKYYRKSKKRQKFFSWYFNGEGHDNIFYAKNSKNIR